MKTLLTVIISQALWNLAQADTIVIKDAKKGTIVAEVNIDAKESKFIHAGRTLTIERKAPIMEVRARKCILNIEFKEATLDEIAFFLHQPSTWHDSNVEPGTPIINFVVIDEAKRNLRMSLGLKRGCLFDALASLARKYELNVEYDDQAITLIDPKRPKKD